jgi:hypothetical protein
MKTTGRQGDGVTERRGEEEKMNSQIANSGAETEKSPRRPVAPSPCRLAPPYLRSNSND